MRRAYDVVIVGAGIQGLARAYELARRGIAGVCVLQASDPGAGASGRNGDLIRSAFSSREWARFFHASLRRHRLSDELEAALLFAPDGERLASAHGRRQVEAVSVAGPQGRRRLRCDAVCIAVGRRPADDLRRQAEQAPPPGGVVVLEPTTLPGACGGA